MAKVKILSAILITLGLLLTAGQAQAQGQCNMGSINEPNGPVAIAINGDCVVNGDITARDYISIQVLNGKITVTGNITSTQHGNVVLRATGPISVGGSVIVDNSAAPSSQAGAVDIDANTVQSGAPFVIGSASSNGVAGTINVNTVNGGGTDVFAIKGGIKIRNRGGVTLSSVTAVSAKATASKAGALIFDGVDGTVSLPTGTLSADGTGNNGAGAIILMGTEVSTQDGTVISATDNGAAGLSHFVNIGASTVSFTGANGLQIRANGGGSGTAGSFVYILPRFSVFVEDNFVPADLVWTVTYPFGVANPSPVTLNGASGSPLTVSANGTSNTQVLLSGYPLALAGGDLALNARGSLNHRIDLTFQGQTNSIDGLVVTANKLTLNANATVNGGTGGDIFVSMPRLVSSSPQQVLMTADGPNSASGAGGTIQFYPRGDVTLGASAGQFHLSAQGGLPGGNGGSIVVQNDFNTTNVASSSALQASARGGNGDGGSISAKSLFLNFNGTGLKVAADALGSGKGGRVAIDVPAGSITVGTGAGQVKLSAEADATAGADGGEVSINVGGSAMIASGQLSVASGASGGGGKIAVTAGGDLALTGSLKANAGLSGNGAGGQVLLSSGTLTLNGSQSGGGQSLSADGAGMGPGGLVSISIEGSFTPTTIAKQQQGAISLSADGGKNATGTFLGAGGTLQMTDLNAGFIIDGAALTVRSGSGQNAGSILVDAGQTLAVSGDLKAVGAGNGANGGTIRLTAQSDNPVVFSGTSTTNINSDGGSMGTTGSGGHIAISNTGTGNIEFQQKVILSAAAEGVSGGTAGKVSITTGGEIVFAASGNRIKTNGNGAAGVENIHLQAAGDIRTGIESGKIELLARGSVSGDRGGFIKLVSTGGDIAIDTAALNVKGGGPGTSAAEGDGGKVEAQAAVDLTVLGDFDASGRGQGSGGEVVLTAAGEATVSGKIDISGGCGGGDGGRLEVTSSSVGITTVNGDSGSNTCPVMGSNSPGLLMSGQGNGGSITINGAVPQGFLAGPLTSLSVDAHGPNGRGGVISIFNAGNPVDLSHLNQSTAAITARGGQNGEGGQIYIADVKKIPNPEHVLDPSKPEFIPLNVHQIIRVDAGASSGPSAFDGSITLNGVVCQQWKTGQNVWPKVYWNCNNPIQPSELDKVPVELASSPAFDNLRILFRDNKLVLSVFFGASDYNAFFGDNLTAKEGGVTFKSGQYIYSNPWESGSIGDPNTVVNYLPNQYKEVVAHELGHAYDISNGFVSLSAAFSNALQADIAAINAPGLTPCGAGNSPYVGIVDLNTGSTVCDGNAVRPIYTGLTNSQIALALDPVYATRQELHAQSFAYAVMTRLGLPKIARPMFDEIADKGYWANIVTFAAGEF